jgi:hypothetical protein
MRLKDAMSVGIGAKVFVSVDSAAVKTRHGRAIAGGSLSPPSSVARARAAARAITTGMYPENILKFPG